MTSYISGSEDDVNVMLETAGVKSIDGLFKDIPEEHKISGLINLPKGISEFELKKELSLLSEKNIQPTISFLGAGSYNHFIPSTVSAITGRSEFYTGYTPYQAEISQGSLQAIYEFQTMIAHLSGMDMANASMYDGATALGESAIMACTHTKKEKVLVAKSVHPEYRQVLHTYMAGRNIEVSEIKTDKGSVDIADLKAKLDDKTAGVIVQSPNFFGIIEDQEQIAEIAHGNSSLFISCVVEAMSLGYLKNPGECGADIFAGEGQSLGISQCYGGPHLGLIAVKKPLLRRLPGRISGKTVDADGKEAFILTLQAREQHIRREKASSNICTNQGLCAIAATVYLSTVGNKLMEIARQNHQKTNYAFESMSSCAEVLFQRPFFNEFVVKIPNANSDIKTLLQKGIIAGLPLEEYYPDMSDCILVCCTEMTTREQIDLLKSEIQNAGGNTQ